VQRHPAGDGVDSVVPADVLDAYQQIGAVKQCATMHRSGGTMDGIILPHGVEHAQQRA